MGNAPVEKCTRDAYGTELEEECWVECGAHAMNFNLGKVKSVRDGVATFHWPGTGDIDYGVNDIFYYGMRRTMADVKGYKLKAGQLFQTTDGKQGLVRKVSDTCATLDFGRGGWDESEADYGQNDINGMGLQVVGTVQGRSCM